MKKTTLVCPVSDDDGVEQTFQGGAASVVVTGTFDSGTVKLQFSWDGGVRWIDATDVNGDAVEFSADGRQNVWEGGTPLARVNLSGSGGATAVTVEIHYGLSVTRDGGLGISL